MPIMQLNWTTFDYMCNVSSTTLAISLATLLVAVAYYYVTTRGLPPGPTGVPYFGSWPFIDSKNSHLQFHDWKKKYGDIFSFNVQGTLYINLGSPKAIHEAYISKSNCFTQKTEAFTLQNNIFSGALTFISNEEWKANHRLFLHSIKKRLTMTFNKEAGSLNDAMKSFVDELMDSKGETVNIVESLTRECRNFLRLTLFGDIGISEEKIREISELYPGIVSSLTFPNVLLRGNIAKYIIFPLMSSYKESIATTRMIENILYKIIDEHKSSYDEENIRDIIDDYIKEKRLRSSKGDITAKFLTDKTLMSSLIQIIGDSVLVLPSFISLFIKSMLDHPEEQEKIFRELVEVVGLDRDITMEDKSKLTYTNAFIQEAVRTADFFPFFPSLECTKETTLQGYRIPIGAITLNNTYSAHLDPEAYPEPHKFDPTRYIVQEGKRKAEPLVTFGVGKRACIAENFSMMQVFLFVTTLVKNFRFELPEGVDDSKYEIYTEGRLRILVQPRN